MTDLDDLLRRLKSDADRSLTVTLNRKSALALVREIERLREQNDPPAFDYRQRQPCRTAKEPRTMHTTSPRRSGQVFWPALLVAAVVFLAFLVRANTRELRAAPAPQPRMYLEQLDAGGSVTSRREVVQFTLDDGATVDASQLLAGGEWTSPPATSIGLELSTALRVVFALR